MNANIYVDANNVITAIVTDPIREGLPLVDLAEIGDVKVGYDKFVDGKIVPMPKPANVQAMERIYELKAMLARTDYEAIKFAEGRLSAVEYQTLSDQRQAWRDEINELEAGLVIE